MLVRLEENVGPALKKALGSAQGDLPRVLASLMTPLSLLGYVLAAWRVCADLNWAGEFFIEKGLLSRWQVWLAAGIAMQLAAQQLSRMGRGGTPKAAS